MKITRRTKRAARALFRMCVIDGVLDQSRARTVAQRLAGSRRRGALPALASFQRLVRLDRDRQSAYVDSAAPLDEALRLRIQAGLTRAYGPAVEAVFRVDPALIGGIRIKVGSDVFDDTVRARLASLDALL
jgi:F-type H+-transporting ATPase subunit delta